MRIILFSLLLLAPKTSEAHAYFFGFAEIAYNDNNQQFEGTIIVSTHDIEEYFQAKNLPIKELEDHIGDDAILKQMAAVLFDEFQMKTNGKTLSLRCIGYEVLPNGLTNFYFQSSKTPFSNKLDIKFNLMMRFLPEQQNKVTFIHKDKSYTSVFTKEKSQNQIILE